MKRMRLFGGKLKGGERNPSNNIKVGRSLPVDRYYSPRKNAQTVRSSGTSTDGQKHKNRGKGNVNGTVTSMLRTSGTVARRAVQWSGFVAIVGILCLNAGLFSVGTKVLYTVDGQSGGESPYRSAGEYKQAVDEVFSRSLLRRSKITFRSDKFEQDLFNELPEISEATAVTPLVGAQLQVGLVIPEPLLRLQDGNRTGIVGRNGRLLAVDVPSSKLGDFFSTPIMTFEPTLDIEAGSQALTTAETDFVELLLSEFDGSQAHRPRIKSLEYRVDKRELRVSFLSVSYYAKMSTERLSREQVGSLVATLSQLEGEGENSIQEYVDVRVDGRVFVK